MFLDLDRGEEAAGALRRLVCGLDDFCHHRIGTNQSLGPREYRLGLLVGMPNPPGSLIRRKLGGGRTATVGESSMC